MSENSKIEWTDHTFNPWEGCTKVSPGCANCYAEARNHRFGLDNWGKGKPRRRTKTWGEPVKWNRDSRQSLVSRRPRVFCASLADWLDDEVPIEWLADLLKLIHDTPNLDWLLLTKRPENWAQRFYDVITWCPDEWDGDDCPAWVHWFQHWLIDHRPPDNVWLGTTVENQEYAEKRIPELLKIPARVRFLSCEPLLEEIQIAEWLPHYTEPGRCKHQRIHWVIAGGESGTKKRRFEADWARSLRDQCDTAAFFMKQIDKVQPIPDDLMIRQFPQPEVHHA